MLNHRLSRSGFTLIELLLVIGIISILASIVIVAINPSYQLAKSRNVQRQSDINTVLNAFDQFAIDNGGAYQATGTLADCSIPLTPAPARKVCAPGITAVTCDFGAPGDGNGCVFMANLQSYVVAFPSDPQDAIGGDEDFRYDYTVLLTSNRRLSISAPNTEIPPAEATYSVAR